MKTGKTHGALVRLLASLPEGGTGLYLVTTKRLQAYCLEMVDRMVSSSRLSPDRIELPGDRTLIVAVTPISV